MPLLDHFHPPLRLEASWESFQSQWASSIAAGLNLHVLSKRFRAEVQITVGGHVEVDVGTLDLNATGGSSQGVLGNGGGTAVLEAPVYAPPEPAVTLPAIFTDEFEVRVFDTSGGLTLVAAIELVSPGNKDRPEARQAFATKCANYLFNGIGLVVVDIVTERHANLHDYMIQMLNWRDEGRFPHAARLYATAYRPARRKKLGDQIDTWFWPLAIGSSLPKVPLALRNLGCVEVDLEAAYLDACQRSRIP